MGQMKVIVKKATLVQDALGEPCIATINKCVMIETNRATHFINSGVAKLAKETDELSPLQKYESSAPVRAKSEATEVGKAIAEAIRETNKEAKEAEAADKAEAAALEQTVEPTVQTPAFEDKNKAEDKPSVQTPKKNK